MSKDLLIEIGCEDLPARFVKPLAGALSDAIADGLTRRGVGAQDRSTYATPRRLAVLLRHVAEHQPTQTAERKGPKLAAALKDGQPTPAGLGFAKTCGVAFDQLAQEDGQLVFRSTQPGRRTVDLIPEIFEDALKAMDALVPKRMRWGAGTETFVRPVEWLTVLFGEDVVPIERFGLRAGRLTYGHRFHAPHAISLACPSDYESQLFQAKVCADFSRRRLQIRSLVDSAWENLLTAVPDQRAAPLPNIALLDEVTALVEWPVVISGKFEDRFLDLPAEVIVTTVETNQRYFTAEYTGHDGISIPWSARGYLAPYFLTIANIESKDESQVVAGNERVIRPRLADALFFWEQDQKQPLSDYRKKLNAVTYQNELGSIGDKVERIRALSHKLATEIGADPQTTDRVAFLAKCDLTTRMVYEMPELQGVMGAYYAHASGESDLVARSIAQHYNPKLSGGPIPSTIEGRIVALADKLDTLAGIFAIGQKPTASKDPYALRRAALGVLRILIEGRLPLDLSALLKSALEAQPDGKGIRKDSAVLADLTDFAFERLRGYYTEQGLPPEMFEAVKALGITVPTDFDARVQALRQFWSRPEAKSLAAAHKRIRNLLKQGGGDGGAVDPARFAHAAETALFDTLVACESAGLAADDFAGRLALLAERLQAPVDAFFDMRDATGEPVMVNDPDPATRTNRLALLRRLDAVCREVADISLLPG